MIDGLVIAAAFVTDIRLGIVTSIAIMTHEIPQEIGDFGVLIHAGFTRTKALLLNFLVALTALFGAVVGYFFVQQVEIMTAYLLPFAAGGFLYIAASDLLPEIRKQKNAKKLILSFSMFLFGVLMMYGLKISHGHSH